MKTDIKPIAEDITLGQLSDNLATLPNTRVVALKTRDPKKFEQIIKRAKALNRLNQNIFNSPHDNKTDIQVPTTTPRPGQK